MTQNIVDKTNTVPKVKICTGYTIICKLYSRIGYKIGNNYQNNEKDRDILGKTLQQWVKKTKFDSGKSKIIHSKHQQCMVCLQEHWCFEVTYIITIFKSNRIFIVNVEKKLWLLKLVFQLGWIEKLYQEIEGHKQLIQNDAISLYENL